MSQAFIPFYVTIKEMTGSHAPIPKPLENGFNVDTEYKVMGIYNASETSECLLLLINHKNELWHIPSRHVRFSHE